MPGPAHVEGKVIGYRAWTLDGHRLRCFNRAFGHWNIGENRAQCKVDQASVLGWSTDHDAPQPDCGCGLHAYFRPPIIEAAPQIPPTLMFRLSHDQTFATAGVAGAIAAWGRVEVHPDGFRAQYARPVALAYHPRDAYEDVVRTQAIAEEFGVAFVPVAELEAEAGKYGRPVPEELRPEPASTGWIHAVPVTWAIGSF